MKKYLRSFLIFSLLSITLTSCSTDEVISESQAKQGNGYSAFRQSYWSGVLGVYNGNGNYQFTVNPQALMADLQNHLRVQGDSVTLHSIAIVNKKATNDNTDGYMLVASDDVGTSVGLMLAMGADNTLKLDEAFGNGEDPYAITCRGCATGCNLEHLNMPGGKFPYCASNGCGDFCQTKQATFE